VPPAGGDLLPWLLPAVAAAAVAAAALSWHRVERPLIARVRSGLSGRAGQWVVEGAHRLQCPPIFAPTGNPGWPRP